MPESLTPLQQLVGGLESMIWICGLALLWRVQFSAAAKARLARGPALAHWPISGLTFAQAALCVLGGAFVIPSLIVTLTVSFGLPYDKSPLGTLVQFSASQGGLLFGAICAILIVSKAPRELPPTTDKTDAPPPLDPPPADANKPPLEQNPWIASVVVFLISVPLVSIVAFLFGSALKALGMPTESQTMVELFKKIDSRTQLAGMIFLAAVIAPLAEELIFRAGFFRFLRTRVPRWIALWAPSTLFALLHVDWVTYEGLPTLLPLVVLAAIYSIAYERTGRVDVVIIAHSLFNLHTVVLLLLGMDST